MPRRALLVALALLAMGGSCSEQRPTTPPPIEEADLPRPDVRLVVLTDLDGYLEPCGCTSRPLGGIDRMAAKVRQLRRDGVPTVFVAAGNLFFGSALHGADVEQLRTQETWKAETVARILDRLELAAAAPGPLDFAFGTPSLEALATAAEFPLLAAGVEVDGASEPIFVPTAIVPAGELQVGLLGLSDLRTASGALPDRVVEREELRAAGRSAAQAVRAQGADIVVALVSGDRRTARRVGGGIPGVDFVVHGGVDDVEPRPPSMAGDAVLLAGGRHGRGLVVVELVRRSDGAWTDASVWTRQAQRAHLDGQIAELRARIAEWEADSNVGASDVATQRARLARLEREAAALVRAPSIEGNVFSARYEELAPEAPRDAAIGRLIDRYDHRVNEHNARAFADWLPEPAPEGQPHYVGSAACASCHGAEMRWWRTTRHGHAYATLADQHKNYNLSCVGCHVTGYLEPGGSTVAHVENLTDVGCENCHGPGSMHVADPEHAAVDVVRDPSERVCLRCHTPEHSDLFDFTAYRQLMIAPGHGMPP